ncbi:aminodeoxychorismate synthase component I [Roseiterribacter gracilis]|uniref:aminodeoxychorismate synthase n=1 Tax=Roseiterribacter gracilis TaxID=2812848 RepID=A0A8S8XH77_9PROT|nr:para-aminobenzoate synthase [Rhodospirillales bacterium TMPK1]
MTLDSVLDRDVVREIAWIDPLAAYASLRGNGPSIWFDSAAGGRWSYVLAEPVASLTSEADATDDPFTALSAMLHAQHGTIDAPPPFAGGVAGFLSYELRRWIERDALRHPADADLPEAQLDLYDTVLAFDVEARRTWLIARSFPASRESAAKRADRWQARLAQPSAVPTGVPTATWHADWQQDEYQAHVAALRQRTFDGEIYQANFTQRFIATRPAGLDPLAAYCRLRELAPAPFATLIELGDGRALASASPERYLRVESNRRVITEPIKGTRPRGRDAAQDDALAQELLRDEKERAENLMIVDLLRNDLGRVAQKGSVVVEDLFAVERFAAVQHLVSRVAATLAPGRDLVDLLRAAFPGGSITGCPKVHAMRAIDDSERARRGAYCGSIAWFGSDGTMDSSIAIRTLTFGCDRVLAQAGGGIVADSDPASEYRECLLKARPLLRTLDPSWAL